ncbi:MAG: PrpF domain-containing protein [Pseudomonadota bacterium]
MTKGIPFLLMRGGTSRGPVFRRNDLPSDRAALDAALLDVVGSGHALCIDGVGGSASVQCKVVMLSASAEDGVDIDYLFAQVCTTERTVDYGPTCGNMMSTVGPASVELGLLSPRDRITLRAVNTGALVEASFVLSGDRPLYAGDQEISGVPGQGSPVRLCFRDIVGAKTDALFPTGNTQDDIAGCATTCIDLAVPVMILRAADLGLTGGEAPERIDKNPELMARIEAMRIEAGKRMGLGDVRGSVLPKVALLSQPSLNGADVKVRYLTPFSCHPSSAVTGAQAVAGCVVMPGTVFGDARSVLDGMRLIRLEHPAGFLDVDLEVRTGADGSPRIVSAAILRTARKIVEGRVFLPA